MKDHGTPEIKRLDPRAITELGPEWADAFDNLRRNPADLLADLRDKPDFAVAVARADTRPYLHQWFEETVGWIDDPEGSGPLGEQSYGVEWSYVGVHSIDEAFNGLPASHREVTLEGFTIIRNVEGKLRIRRHVHWVGVFQQLGLTLNWRIPLEDPPRPPPG